MQAAMTEIRLTAIIVVRLFMRFGERSIQRPTKAEKQIAANDLTIPLQELVSIVKFSTHTNRMEAAKRVLGNAAAVKMIW
jgi:exosome complex RNA-binding protein Rrp42 (RNase PH superfamily)